MRWISRKAIFRKFISLKCRGYSNWQGEVSDEGIKFLFKAEHNACYCELRFLKLNFVCL